MKSSEDILGFNICQELPQTPENGKIIINTINPHSYIIAKKDILFKKAIIASNYIIADGFGFVLASKILNKKKIFRITGSDLHKHFLIEAESKLLKVFYLGADEKTLECIKAKVSVEYPSVSVNSYSPPFKNVFSPKDNEKIIKSINKISPDILFIGMTAPKQEKWEYINSKYLNVKVICSIGAVFDYYSEKIIRPKEIWQKAGLEWLIRLIKDPRRLWKRTFKSMPEFVIEIIKYKILSKKYLTIKKKKI